VKTHLAHEFVGAHVHVVDDDGIGKRPISRVDLVQASQLMPGGGCRLGQLTALGASQASQLGGQMAERYQRLGLLHSKPASSEEDSDENVTLTTARGSIPHEDNHNHALDLGCDLVARSTNVARCVATLSFALGKMLEVVRDAKAKEEEDGVSGTSAEPKQNRKAKRRNQQEVPVVVHTRDHNVEYLTPNRHCDRMMQMMEKVKKVGEKLITRQLALGIGRN
jgi:hypothetical protein